METGYDNAQVCLNGHPTNRNVEDYPDRSQPYCDKCGEKTITACQHCKSAIRGWYQGAPPIGNYVPPNFCHNCGKPYPWTESRLEAAAELAEEIEGLTDEERETVKKSLADLVKDTPRTTVAATRFKRLASRAGKETANAFRQLLVDIVSETARKTIWGP